MIYACRLVIVPNNDALDICNYGLTAVIMPNISMTIVHIDCIKKKVWKAAEDYEHLHSDRGESRGRCGDAKDTI